MKVSHSIRDPSKLNEAMKKAPYAIIRSLRLGVKVGIRDIQQTARAIHRFTSRTGHTEMAIDTAMISDDPPAGKVFINDAVSPYGRYIHEGTDPHVIRPRFKKMLRWPAKDGSGFVFPWKKGYVDHPGTKADPFIHRAARLNRESYYANMNKYTARGIKEAGL